MATPKAKNVSVGDLAASVVANDPQLREELRGIVANIIDRTKFTLQYGTPAEKNAIMRHVAPHLLAGLNKVEEGAGDTEQRAAYERMLAHFRGEAPAPESISEAS